MLEKRGSAGKIISFCELSQYVSFTDLIVWSGPRALGHFLPRWLGHLVGSLKRVVFAISNFIVKALVFSFAAKFHNLGFHTEYP